MSKSVSLFFYVFLMGVIISSSGCKDKCDGPNLNVDEAQLQADIEAIDEYLSRNGINAEEHPSGIRYVFTREGNGKRPDACDRVAVSYTGTTFDGNIFDETKDPVTFSLTNLITGWQIGIPLLKESGRITLYIPSVYAYGARGSGSAIGPNESLIFEIYLFRVL